MLVQDSPEGESKDLLEKMRRKNELREKRYREVEEDKRMFT